MLTDLSFLNVGKPWPPPSERGRLALYERNKALFAGEHHREYNDAARRVQQTLGDFGDVIAYCLLLNYQQLISKKTADLIFGEWPTITSRDKAMQAFIDKLMQRSDLMNQCYQAALDVSRYGDGTLGVARWPSGVLVYVGRTDCWYPVVDPANIKNRLYDVTATVVIPDGERPEQKELHVEIHGVGYNEVRRHRLVGGIIGAQLLAPQVAYTGLPGVDFWQIPNIATSDSVHGLDDYTAVNSLVEEVQVRLAQIAKVLDKHAEPSMQGPESALQEYVDRDGKPTGQYHVRAGNFFVNQARGAEPPGMVSYLTWDANLTAAFEQVNKVLGQLRTVSEMGALLMDTAEHAGQMPTGTALRTLLTNALAKVARIRTVFDPVLKQAIQAAAQLAGVTPAEVSIKWFDGLPDDPVETAQIVQLRTSGKQTMSVETAIMEADGKTQAEAQEETDRIEDEAQAAVERTMIESVANDTREMDEEEAAPPDDAA